MNILREIWCVLTGGHVDLLIGFPPRCYRCGRIW